MYIGYILILIGLIGFIYNRHSIVILYLMIEIMLLGTTISILEIGYINDDSTGLIWTLILLIIAGAESAIGLSLLVSYYRIIGNINMEKI